MVLQERTRSRENSLICRHNALRFVVGDHRRGRRTMSGSQMQARRPPASRCQRQTSRLRNSRRSSLYKHTRSLGLALAEIMPGSAAGSMSSIPGAGSPPKIGKVIGHTLSPRPVTNRTARLRERDPLGGSRHGRPGTDRSVASRSTVAVHNSCYLFLGPAEIPPRLVRAGRYVRPPPESTLPVRPKSMCSRIAVARIVSS
jgi:hypothetical protein